MSMKRSNRVTEYILKAEWCAAQAAATLSEPMRQSFREIERQWRELAKQVTQAELAFHPQGIRSLPLVLTSTAAADRQ